MKYMKVMIRSLFVFMLLRLVCCQDIISTIAGTGSTSYSGDNGAATSATLYYPAGIALDASGRILYYCPLHRAHSETRVVRCSMKYFFFFFDIPVSNIGNVYIADTSNNRIRKVTESTGIISTIAGSSTSASYSGDNGAATSATLSNPVGVALDASGRILYYCPLHRYTVSSAMSDEIFFNFVLYSHVQYRQRVHR